VIIFVDQFVHCLSSLELMGDNNHDNNHDNHDDDNDDDDGVKAP